MIKNHKTKAHNAVTVTIVCCHTIVTVTVCDIRENITRKGSLYESLCIYHKASSYSHTVSILKREVKKLLNIYWNIDR